MTEYDKACSIDTAYSVMGEMSAVMLDMLDFISSGLHGLF
jgi:hypothetical protein